MLPAQQSRQRTGAGQPAHLNLPQNTMDVKDEAQMAQRACQKIRARLRMARLFQMYRAHTIPNNYAVSIISDPESVEGKITFSVYENKAVVPLTVKNCGVHTVCLTFQAFELVENIFAVRDCHGKTIKTVKRHVLRPGEAFEIKVRFCSEHTGFYEQLLIFTFETHQKRPSDRYDIMRILEVTRLTSVSEEPPEATNALCDLESLGYTDDKRNACVMLEPVELLKQYAVPEGTKDLERSDAQLEKPLTWKHYSWRFHLLLHLEELHQTMQLQKLKRDAVPLFRYKKSATIFYMQIADDCKSLASKLSENDVLVTRAYTSEAVLSEIYEGSVLHVEGEYIYLKLEEAFEDFFMVCKKFRVEFFLNRIPLRYQHRAVALVYRHKLKEVLYPTGQFSSQSPRLHSLTNVNSNPEQCTAIQHIMAASAKPAPYMVFGPPGTGKTVTLVEAIKQIKMTWDTCKILVCAPSNSAADNICVKLAEALDGVDAVYRLYALSWSVAKIPIDRKFKCNLSLRTYTLMIPCKSSLMKQGIIVTTLTNVGRLVTGGIPPGHYAYIFVDEAGQATEAECVIPLAGLMNPQTCQLVLAGDPKQLGPVVTSQLAEKHGLGLSLLERLMTDIKIYQYDERQGFNKCFVTKLLRNYRSHPAILKIPNELFYRGELKPYANMQKCSSYCNWKWLPKKGFPLIFHGVAGTHQRDADSPSVYNMAEVEVLKQYLKALIRRLHSKGVAKIEPEEIGIITPYSKQVEKIQKALQTDKDLQKEQLGNIMIGSVEKFQGKECNAILVSTVRSNPKMTAPNQRLTLGFVNNEKRFNVAITRARALLIVVGDPRLLKTDQMWNKFVHYCYKEGGYRGITVSDAEEKAERETNSHPRT